jgi:K+ transporter
MLKFADGGWVPVLFAIVLFALMRIWQTGYTAMQAWRMKCKFRSAIS